MSFSSTSLELDNNASFHIMGLALNRIAEALENNACQTTSSSPSGGTTPDPKPDSSATVNPTSSPSSGTKVAKTTVKNARVVSNTEPFLTLTQLVTQFAKTAATSAMLETAENAADRTLETLITEAWTDKYWVEMDEDLQSWLTIPAPATRDEFGNWQDPPKIVALSDGWTLSELLYEAAKYEYEHEGNQ